MAGRPSKLTPQTQDRIVKALRGGNTRADSALAAGVGRETFRRWMAAGQGRNARTEFRAFRAAVEKAESAAAMRFVGTIKRVGTGRVVVEETVTTNPDGTTTTHRKYAPPTWQCAAWYLERRRRQQFGRPYRMPEGQPDREAVDNFLAGIASAQSRRPRKPAGGAAGTE